MQGSSGVCAIALERFTSPVFAAQNTRFVILALQHKGAICPIWGKSGFQGLSALPSSAVLLIPLCGRGRRKCGWSSSAFSGSCTPGTHSFCPRWLSMKRLWRRSGRSCTRSLRGLVAFASRMLLHPLLAEASSLRRRSFWPASLRRSALAFLPHPHHGIGLDTQRTFPCNVCLDGRAQSK